MVIVNSFANAVENRLDVIYDFVGLLERNYFAFFVLPDFFSCRKLIFPAYISRRVFADAVDVIMRQRRNDADAGLVFVFLELIYLLLDIVLVAEKRMRQKIRNRYDIFLRNTI